MANATSFKIYKANRGTRAVLVVPEIPSILPYKPDGYEINELRDILRGELAALSAHQGKFTQDCIRFVIIALDIAGKKTNPFRFIPNCPKSAATPTYYTPHLIKTSLVTHVLQL